MTERAFTSLRLPERPPKPRKGGWTIPTDPGMALSYQEGMLEARGELVDYVKFIDHAGLATYYTAEWLKKKMDIYKRFGIGIFLGGASFELASLLNTVSDFFKTVKEVGFTGVEISDDMIEPIPREKRAALMREAKALGLDVFTEVGRKLPDEPLDPQKTIDNIQFDLDTGAVKVAIETADADLLKETNPQVLIDIVNAVGMDNVIFEAQRAQAHLGPNGREFLVWLLETLGPGINIMTISFEDLNYINYMRGGMGLAMRGEFLSKIQGKKA